MNAPPGGFIKLSTDQFAERDRVEAAREIIGRSLMKLEFELRPDVPFNVDMVFRVLPDFALATGVCSPMDCLRTPQLIDSNDLVLSVARSPCAVLHVRGREIPIGGGTAALTRMSDVCRCALHSTSEMINFRFRFDKIAPLIADLDAAALRPIPVNTEPLRLLVNYAEMLNNENMLATPEVRNLVSTHLHDLAALAIGATPDATALAGRRGVRVARLHAIKADIVRNIASPRLSVESVSARHGISPRYVSMLFESDATTFSEFVLMRRLHLAHRMLVDPRLFERTVISIAFEVGFGTVSYFNRAFRRRYGLTPSDVRARAQNDAEQ